MQRLVGAEREGSGRARGVVVPDALAESGVGGGDGGAVGVYPELEGAGVELGVDCLRGGADFDWKEEG